MNLLRIANRVAAPVSSNMSPDEIFMIRWTTRADIAREFHELGVTKEHVSPNNPALTFDFCRAIANDLEDVDPENTEGYKKVFTNSPNKPDSRKFHPGCRIPN